MIVISIQAFNFQVSFYWIGKALIDPAMKKVVMANKFINFKWEL